MDPKEIERRRQEGLEIRRRAAALFGPDPLEKVLRLAGELPPDWCVRPERDLDMFRHRFGLRQRDLARFAGLTRTQVVRLEGGRDALLSTLRKAYAALGFELLLVPRAAVPLEALEERWRLERTTRYPRGKRRKAPLSP